MTGWQAVTLGDVLTLQRGFDITRATQRDGAVPVVSSSGINSYHDTAMANGPGVVIGRKGTLGTAFYVEGAYWPHDTTLWVKDFKGNDPRFCYYLLKSLALEKYDVGAANPTLNRNHVHLLHVLRPPLKVQQRIAAVLRNYEDLIEVNRRRIALIEKMARRLFEEWFIHFRFPGHNSEPLVRVGGARLPRGWQVKALADVAAVNADTIKPAEAPSHIGYIDISSVSVGSVEKIEWMPFGDAPGRARRRVRDGSIIWSMVRPNRRSYALLLDPSPDTVASTGFAVLDAQALPPAYLFHAVTTDDFVGYLTGHATGAAYPAVTGAVFERASIVVPPAELAACYAKAADPMLRLASKLHAANVRLAASRDLLLPRLISGDLPVAAGAERELEVAA